MSPVYHIFMQARLVMIRFLSWLTIGLASLGIWTAPLWIQSDTSPYLQVHFLDVGQGDAIFIETPDGVQVLVDAGAGDGVIREIESRLSLWDREIDMIISTHLDRDHIGGLIDVLERFSVASVVMTEQTSDTNTAKTYKDSVIAEQAVMVTAKQGQIINLGASTTLEVLFPTSAIDALDSNASSVMMQLHYGDTTFMLTGDAPKRIEEYLVLQYGEHLKSDVLKVGHHGSRTSTSELFLAEVDPDYAVISAGEDNRYGHPHVEVTDALFNAGVETFKTANEGTITFYSDGEEVFLNTSSPF